MLDIFQQAQAESLQHTTRRHFLKQCATGLGGLWMGLEGQKLMGASGLLDIDHGRGTPFSPLSPSYAARAKRVIFIHLIGAPSQYELFAHKPELVKYDGKTCPDAYLEGQRFAFISGKPNIMGPIYPMKQYGESGAYFSDRLPHLSKHADDLCFIHSMQTDQFNHGPAQLMIHTGNANLGHPSIGSWVSYGLGSENSNLPGFMVLLSGGRLPRVGKSLWGSGYLPSVYQGVQCQSGPSPILNVQNPKTVSSSMRQQALETLKTINQRSYEEYGDPEILTRIAQYEMAFRMQSSVPEVMDIASEDPKTLELYGANPGKESLANNCLLARKLVENGVRFVQLYDWGWDSHGASQSEALNAGFQDKCRQMDRPVSALLTDLKQRGLLEDTLVVWGGEFGRTPMQENRGGGEMTFQGRDHNPNSFTMWMAGASVKPGFSYGETDPLGYHVEKNPVHVRDLHATMVHMLGYDHERLAVPFQGLNQKLTGVKKAKVIHDLLM